MTAAGKGLLTVLSEELTPMVKRTVGNPQIAGNLGQRFVAGFHQLNRFQFELFRKRSLSLLHGLFPSWRMSTSSSLPSPLSRVKTIKPLSLLRREPHAGETMVQSNVQLEILPRRACRVWVGSCYYVTSWPVLVPS